jgi:Acetyltransferase (GNAT) domain
MKPTIENEPEAEPEEPQADLKIDRWKLRNEVKTAPRDLGAPPDGSLRRRQAPRSPGTGIEVPSQMPAPLLIQPLPEAEARRPLIPTVFHEDWWLDAVTGGDYSVVEVSESGKAVGRLPFLLRARFGLRGIWTPSLTHFLGPGVDEGNGGRISRFLRRMEITRELILKLPRSAWQCIRCHRGISDAIAFQEQAFKTYAQFTHELAAAPVAELWRQMRDKTRNVIRRASEDLRIDELEDVEEFIRTYQSHLASRHLRNTLDFSAARRVFTAALDRKRGKILTARDANNEIVAANFCAWDNDASYYVACTRSETAGNGASSLLLWEAIQHAAVRGRVFDFAGLGANGSVLHYAGFGATVGTRFVAVRAKGIGRVIARARVLLMDEHYLF